MLKKKLKIVGSLKDTGCFGPHQIRNTILQGGKALSINSDFTGRPETNIFASDSEVVKIRRDLKLTARQASPWLDSVLEKERRLGVHHPDKTWFYIYLEREGVELENEEVLIGNITPRLRPLHKLLEATPQNDQERSEARALIGAMFSRYLYTAKTFDLKMDEGLSNFAIDGEGQLFYVDDEIYHWDKFISFSVMLGVMIRKLEWLDREFVRHLAIDLGEALDHTFNDLNYRASIAYQLRSAFMPAGKKRDLANLFSATLTQQAGQQEAYMAAFSDEAEATPVVARVETEHRREPCLESVAAEAETQAAADDETAGMAVPRAATAPRMATAEAADTRMEADAPLAVLADVHANLPALEAVLDWLQQQGIRQGVVLGDLVGYGPDAAEVVDRLRATGFRIIKGNHDHAVALGAFERGLSKSARHVAEWTHGRLPDHARDWLKQLPPILETEGWMAVHGAPLDPEFFYGYVYEMTYRENLDKLSDLQRRICFHGHSHMPGVYGRDAEGQDRHRVGDQLALGEFDHCLVCPGSVGQPRNGSPLAQFAIYYPERDEVSFQTLTYDYEPVVERMKAENFPADLCRRLAKGI